MIVEVLRCELIEKVNVMVLLQCLLTVESSFNFCLVFWVKMEQIGSKF
jgi:hypothetical protein